jgi:uncharacterized protein (TIGR02145 family)
MKKLLIFFILFCLYSVNTFPKLKLTCPNGGEKFVVGSDTIITWEGIEKERRVKLEYSTDNGNTWFLISKKAFGLKYIWKKLPNQESNEFLVRITTNLLTCPDVKIGNQIWTGCNLDVDYYRNGDSIPEITDAKDTTRLSSGAWCYLGNDPSLGNIYGKHYNWFAVNDPRGLAPLDYHIPTLKEWKELVDYIGDSTNAGGKLKTTGTRENGDGLWCSPNIAATNEYGFSAIPSERSTIMGGNFTRYYSFSTLWSSTENRDIDKKKHSAYGITIYSDSALIYLNSYVKTIGMSIRCVRYPLAPPNQADTSDAVFSISYPKASSKDIDMKKCFVGTPKDSLITDLISNTGVCKFRVDSIYFTGTDAGAFKLISDFPKYILNQGERKASHIEFIPNRIGIHTAKINIITQSDTLVNNIIGEGVEQKIEILSKQIDFGTVDVGSSKTILDTALIKNVSSSELKINSTYISGTDKAQFEIISGGGQFTLQPNEIRKLSVMYQPIKPVISSAQLNFEYNYFGSPAIVQLLGTGASILHISINNDSSYAGQEKQLKLVLNNAKPEIISDIANSYTAKIRFQKTILSPQNRSTATIINDSTYVNVSGAIGTSVELAQIPVVAGLGKVEQTTIDIVDFILKDAKGNKVDFDIKTTSGLFKLLGICREGGTRLINPTGKAEILSIIPNPASDDIEININLIEEGNTTLSIYNTNGTKLNEFYISGKIGLQTIKLNARVFPNGLYFIELQTPTVVENRKLMIIK